MNNSNNKVNEFQAKWLKLKTWLCPEWKAKRKKNYVPSKYEMGFFVQKEKKKCVCGIEQ